ELAAATANPLDVWARIWDKNNGSRDYHVNIPPLSATAATASQVNLTWQDLVSGETGWKIKYWADGETTGHYTTQAQNSTDFAVTNLDESTKYFFRVRAVDSNGNVHQTAYSLAKSAITLLKAPTDAIATAQSPTQIVI